MLVACNEAIECRADALGYVPEIPRSDGSRQSLSHQMIEGKRSMTVLKRFLHREPQSPTLENVAKPRVERHIRHLGCASSWRLANRCMMYSMISTFAIALLPMQFTH